MSDELLTTALCWELDGKVSATYAHAQPSLTLHCPDPRCLARVVPAKLKNVFFRAPSRHQKGCRWEKEIVENSAMPGVSRPTPSPLLPAVIPTLLGRGLAIRRRPAPSIADLRQMAERLERAPIIHPGTLHEVIEAWCEMTTEERMNHPLAVDEHHGSYAAAFSFLPRASSNILELNCDRQIVFGGAEVTLGTHFIFVTTMKKFSSENARLQMSFRVPKGAPSAVGLAHLEDASVTAFWRGPVPSKDTHGRYFTVTAPEETIYDGLIVKRGHWLP